MLDRSHALCAAYKSNKHKFENDKVSRPVTLHPHANNEQTNGVPQRYQTGGSVTPALSLSRP